jgi:hypothetical protein
MEPNTDYPAYHDAKLNWDDLDWLKGLAGDVPIYLKGVCHIDVSYLSSFCPPRLSGQSRIEIQSVVGQ